MLVVPNMACLFFSNRSPYPPHKNTTPQDQISVAFVGSLGAHGGSAPHKLQYVCIVRSVRMRINNNYFYINFVDDIEDPEKDQSDATHYL